MRRRNGQHFEDQETEKMKTWKYLIPVTAVLLLAGQAAAQTEEEERQRAAEAREVEVEQRLRDAEEKMAEAARVIAELTKERLPRIVEFEKRYMDASGKPRLGVTIDDAAGKGPVEGVAVLGVTPGSAADEAGLRAGDVLTSVNDESLSADNGENAARRLLDFMQGVEEGDKIDVEYLRNGNVGKVTVEPRKTENEFTFFAGRDFEMPAMPFAPEDLEHFKHQFRFAWTGNSWGDMELVEINEGLGKYFGTDEGLLVVRAPQANALQLEEGDVIQSIDGRKPTSVGHAMRILGSYQPGESLELSIMRDKKRRKLDIQIPDDRTGMLYE
jgi:C-terminal processing protease CtpA/Prc